MTTAKAIPKDIDILVTIASRADTRAIAGAARKLKGQTHYITLNADVFLVDAAGNCIGRTCPFREPSPRARCRGLSCGHDTHVCDDTADLKLARDLILAPPIELWPQVVRRVAVPADVESILLAALELPEAVA